MNDHRYMKKRYGEATRGHQNYGFKDKQGREVGYGWKISNVTVELLPEGTTGGWIYGGEPLRHIEVYSYPTRDGRHYGASTRPGRVKTAEEATAFVERRMTRALKRDAKKFVK